MGASCIFFVFLFLAWVCDVMLRNAVCLLTPVFCYVCCVMYGKLYSGTLYNAVGMEAIDYSHSMVQCLEKSETVQNTVIKSFPLL